MPDETSPVLLTGPVTQTERIQSLDVLRGVAVLGILVMNVQSFSMIGAAYINPTAYGDLTGANYAARLLSHVLADMKFIESESDEATARKPLPLSRLPTVQQAEHPQPSDTNAGQGA